MAKKHYADNSGMEITNGFYLDSSNTEVIYVEEVLEGIPMVEGYLGRMGCTARQTLNWEKINNPRDYIELRQHELNWMKKKLSQLEKQVSGNKNQNAQNLQNTDEREPTYDTQSGQPSLTQDESTRLRQSMIKLDNQHKK